MENAFYGTLVLLPVLYTLSVIAYARVFSSSGATVSSGMGRYSRPLLVTTILFHAGSVAFRGIQIGSCPMGSHWEFFSLVSLSIAITYFFVELKIHDRNTGVFVIAVAAFLQLVASAFMLPSKELAEVKLGSLVSLQAITAIVGYSAVLVSSIYGLLYLSLYGAIKKGSYGLFFRKVPSLETLCQQNYHAAWVAFFAFTASLLFDGLTPMDLPSEVTSSALLERMVTGAAWILFGVCVLSRRFFHLGGKRLAYATVVGFLLPTGLLCAGLIGGGILG